MESERNGSMNAALRRLFANEDVLYRSCHGARVGSGLVLDRPHEDPTCLYIESPPGSDARPIRFGSTDALYTGAFIRSSKVLNHIAERVREPGVVDASGKVVPVRTEEEAFARIGVKFVPPERRSAYIEHIKAGRVA